MALRARAGPIGGIEAASVCLLTHSPQSSMNLLTISFREIAGYVTPWRGKSAPRPVLLTFC